MRVRVLVIVSLFERDTNLRSEPTISVTKKKKKKTEKVTYLSPCKHNKNTVIE